MQNKKTTGLWRIATLATFILSGMALILSAQVSAQEKMSLEDMLKSAGLTTPVKEDEKKELQATIFSNINIRNAQIKEMGNNSFQIDFEVTNFMDVQSNLIYGLELLRKIDDTTIVLSDSKVFPEDKLTIKKDETVKRKINYQAPEFLSGEYELMLEIKDESGLALEFIRLIVVLNGSGEYAEFGNPCYVTIKEEADEKYSLVQGVDLKKEEKLFLECQITNQSDKDATFTPMLSFYERDSFGKEVSTQVAEDQKISFASKESKLTKIAIPLPEKPQAYDVKIYLQKEGKNFSNPIVAHFVVAGPSATINNASLDKSEYKNGEAAVISAMLSTSADGFVGSRNGMSGLAGTILEAEIKDEKDAFCAEKYTYDWAKEGTLNMVDLSVPITKDCVNPSVSLKLIKDGEVLYGKNLDLSQPKKTDNVPIIGGDNKIETFLVALIAIILLIVLAWKLKSVNKIALFIIFFLVVGFIFMNEARADGVLIRGQSYMMTLTDQTAYGATGVALSECDGGGVSYSTQPLCSTVAANPNTPCRVDANPSVNFRAGVWNGSTWVGPTTTYICYQDQVSFVYGFETARGRRTYSYYQGERGLAGVRAAAIASCNNGVSVGALVSLIEPHVGGAGGTYQTITPLEGKYLNQPMLWNYKYFDTSSYSIGAHHAQFYMYFYHGASGTANGTQYFANNTYNYSILAAAELGTCGTKSKYSPPYPATATVADWNADSWCSSPAVATFPNGAVNFPNPGQTTVNWTCPGSGGGADKTDCHASRGLANPIVTLSANPTSVNLNNGTHNITPKSTTLTWGISNLATACVGGCTCTASDDWSGDKASTGGSEPSPQIGPGANPTYVLTCTNATGGTGSNSVTVGSSCDPVSWHDTTCSKNCGVGVYECHNITNGCQKPDNCDDLPCNLADCPVSSEWREVTN